MKHLIAALGFGFAVLAGWATAAGALSCSFPVDSEQAPLTLQSVTVGGVDDTDRSQYPEQLQHLIRVDGSGAPELAVVNDVPRTLSIAFEEEGQ